MRKSSKIGALLVLCHTLSGCIGPVEWWHRINSRSKDLLTLRARHEVLEKELKDLNKKYLALEHKYVALQNDIELERARKQNQRFAGDREGRHIANIKVVEDSSKSPISDRARLAIAHVERGQFPEAFALFESFLWLPEGSDYQTVSTFYTAGIAAFQVKNFTRAREYFEAAVSHANPLADQETIRRTKLWLKVLSKRSDREVASHP